MGRGAVAGCRPPSLWFLLRAGLRPSASAMLSILSGEPSSSSRRCLHPRQGRVFASSFEMLLRRLVVSRQKRCRDGCLGPLLGSDRGWRRVLAPGRSICTRCGVGRGIYLGVSGGTRRIRARRRKRRRWRLAVAWGAPAGRRGRWATRERKNQPVRLKKRMMMRMREEMVS